MKHPLLATLAATAVALSVTPAAVAANLLLNPSFESPGCAGNCILDTPGEAGFITGWTTFLSGVEYYSAGASAADGTMVVDLANYTYGSGGIQQTFATTPGASYTLTFFAGNTLQSGRTGDGWVRVELPGVDTTVDTATATTAAYVWKEVSLNFTASASTSTLKFSNTQDSYTHFALIDHASVTAVPEPETYALMLAGLGVLGATARRRSARPRA